VHAGDSSIVNINTGQLVYAEEIIWHEDYLGAFNSETRSHDIALIKLQEPLVFNEYVQPVSLANECNLKEEYEGVGLEALISGWGDNSIGSGGSNTTGDPTTLQSELIEIISLHEADSLNALLSNDPIPLFEGKIAFYDTLLANQNASGAGDSGGPAVLYQNDQNLQIGITSYKEKFSNHNITPSIYTRVSYYYDWIKEKTGLEDLANEIIINVNNDTILPGINPSVCYGSDVILTTHHKGDSIGFEWMVNGELFSTDSILVFNNMQESIEVELNLLNVDCEIYDKIQITVGGCCKAPEGAIELNDIASSELVIDTLDSFDEIYINGVFEINSHLDISDKIVYMGPNAKVSFGYGGDLSIQSSIIESCSADPWRGIVIDDTTANLTVRNSTISDAHVGVEAYNNSEVTIENVAFINNNSALGFENYSDANFLIQIEDIDVIIDDKILPSLNQYSTVGIRLKDVNDFTLGLSNTLNEFIFENLYSGILSINSTTMIEGVNFVNIPRAIYSHTTSNNLAFIPNLIVYNCDFNNCSSSIYGLGYSNDTHLLNIDIRGNTFTNINMNSIYVKNIGNQSTIANNNFTNILYGIRLGNVNSSYTPIGVDIYANSFTNVVKNGIWIQNINSSLQAPLNIFDNDIELTSSSLSIEAIKIENVSGMELYENNIELNSTSPLTLDYSQYLKGIFIAESQKNRVYDNTFTNLGEGIHGVGKLQLTDFTCNSFTNNLYGFYFDQGNQTVLTNQGALDKPTDNYWIDSDLSNSFRIYEGGLGKPINWYHRDEGGFNASTNSSTSKLTTNDEATGADLCNSIDVYENINHWLETVAQGDYIYPVNDPEYKYRDQKVALKSVRIQPLLYSDNSIIQSFVASKVGTDLEKVLNVDQALSEGDVETAQTVNSQIIADEIYTSNRKIVNDIYLNYLANNGVLSNVEEFLLEDIALQAPYVGGDAVYSARVLLDLDVDDLDVDELGVEYRYSQEINTNQKNELSISVFPNPSNGLYNIKSTQELTRVEVYNLIGRLVKQVDLTINEYELDLSSESNGIYLLKFNVSGKEIWKKAVKQ